MASASLTWKIELLGGFRAVAEDGATVERFRTQKALLLFARLVLSAPATVSREHLGEWLWPDRPPTDQRARLRYELNALRSALGASAIRSVGNDFLTLGEGISCDVDDFRRAAAAALWEDAAAFYAGDLLPGIYDDWILEQQTLLRDAARDAFQQAINRVQREGRIADARQLHRTLFERISGLDASDAPLPPPPLPAPPLPESPLPPEPPLLPTADANATALIPLSLPEAPLERRRTGIGRARLRRAAPILAGAVVYCAAVWGIRAAAPQWDFAADYSTERPTFHDWRVGSLRLTDNDFQPMQRSQKPGEMIHTWVQPRGYGNVNKNVAAYMMVAYTAQWRPGQASLHPNYQNRPATAIRWTCPYDGMFAVQAHFAGISRDADRGATVNLHFRRNDALLWDDFIHGSVVFMPRENPHPTANHDAVIRLSRGETLTWFVDDAGAFLADQVGADLTIRPLWAERLISAAPLIALPLALLAGFIVRRRIAKNRL